MTRKKAIIHMTLRRDELKHSVGDLDEDIKAFDMAIQALEQTSWIPVSERLPENHDDVLVWIEYIKDDYDCAWWALAYYSRQHKKWVVSTNGRNPIVKAWMPLPLPYKASPTGVESEGGTQHDG